MSDRKSPIDVSVLRRDMRCKVCRMLDTHEDLFFELHESYVLKGFTVANLYRWLNAEIAALNQDHPENSLEFISDTSIGTHFQKHVPQQYIINSRLTNRAFEQQEKAPFPSAIEKRLQAIGDTADKANLDDFNRLYRLSDIIETRFLELNAALGSTGVTLESAMPFAAFATSVARMLETVIKLRNQDKLMQAALISCVDSFSLGALQILMQGIDRLAAEYRPHFRNPEVAEHFATKLRELVGAAVTDSARAAVTEVRAQVKIA